MVDTAKFEDVALTPGRMAYAWFFGMPGLRKDGCDGIDWPVNGQAPYIVWRWSNVSVELWHVSTLNRVRLPLDHPSLKQTKNVPTDNITPKYVADRIRKRMAMFDRVGRSYLIGCEGIANFLDTLPNFNVEVQPTFDVGEEMTSGRGEDPMAKKEGGEAAKTEKKQGSGAFIREQLLLKNVKSDEEIAALAREKFKGKTGVSDVAWNRNKLRKEGKLPPAERKVKEAKPKAKVAKAPKKGKTITSTAEAESEAEATDKTA